MSSVESDSDILLDLLVEWDEARREHREVSVSELCKDHPDLIEPLKQRIARRLHIEQMITPSKNSDAVGSRGTTSPPPSNVPIAVPSWIGRYRCERLLGSGGFGLVYLAHDDELHRQVAIKVPHPEFVSSARSLETYRAEARSLAKLEHPHIVPVYDVGSTEAFPCFVVSKYIDGDNLARRAKQRSISLIQIVDTIATIAETLHFSHTHGFVHRDVKPMNILLGNNEHPYLIDFGLALDEQNTHESRRFAGTPAYMSPEQARGESHRVDGRSDIYSLGTVLYELLVGRRPFDVESHRKLLNKIAHEEPKPPRQIDDRVSKELERICLKAMAKRVTERYTTAKDFADDLRCYLATLQRPHEVTQVAYSWTGNSPTFAEADKAANSDLKVIPRGLRSFDEQDADFFLGLLPGPHDRDGIPESVRFWKHRIEKRDEQNTLSVCVLYGPSGSGKSSLVRAGVLPLLDSTIVSIVIDAAPASLESELVRRIHTRLPQLQTLIGLSELLAAMRRGDGIKTGCKFLLVFDQFEQWLHGASPQQRESLLEALRQCDGVRLQALLLVRDDFWMGITRFMHELEVPLIQGQNSNVNDLFSIAHARRVLIAFGQAWGLLPNVMGEMSSDQNQFLDDATQGLAKQGFVVPVRLALFAEMIKHQPWVPKTLQEVGGLDGLGVAFLEATFSSPTAPPTHRYHQAAARRVLGAFLPSSNVDFRGKTCSHEELLIVAGYGEGQDEFDELMRMLNSELRLITPVEGGSSTRRFQLAHDYLVPSLRNWFERKQRETRRGRALLQLDEIASVWEQNKDRRFLPTLSETISIRCFTRPSDWKPGQSQLMRTAVLYYLSRWGVAIVAAVGLIFGLQSFFGNIRQTKVRELLEAVESSSAAKFPLALKRLNELPKHVLQSEIQTRSFGRDKHDRIRHAFALAELGQLDSKLLIGELNAIEKDEFPNLYHALRQNRDASLNQLHTQASRELDENNLKSRAQLAITAIYLDDLSLAIEMAESQYRADHAQRRALIDAITRWPHDLQELADKVATISNSALRSAICLGLAGIPRIQLSAENKAIWEPIFLKWFQDAPDAATHSASGIVLFYWEFGIPALEAPKSVADRDWFVNSMRMTMIRIPPNGIQSGNTREKNARSLYLCDREINMIWFQQFVNDPLVPDSEKAQLTGEWDPPSPLHPVGWLSWTDAVLFCNWLSKKEGLVPCYIQDGSTDKFGKLVWSLDGSATGYRLPSEAEWEYACLAGEPDTSALSSDPNVSRYVQYNTRGSSPCALHYPNAWGMFDMLGNVEEWCGEPVSNAEGPSVACRGGSAIRTVVTSGPRIRVQPNQRVAFAGFRVCREIDSP